MFLKTTRNYQYYTILCHKLKNHHEETSKKWKFELKTLSTKAQHDAITNDT